MENNIIQLPYKFDPRPYQLDFFKAIDSGKYDRFFLRWCRRCGKDKTCIALIGRLLWQKMESCYFLFPSYAQGRKILWEGVDKNNNMRFLDHIPEELRQSVNNNEMKLTLKNGSTFRVMGTEDIDSLVGTNPSIIVFSEWALQNPKIWDFLRPILEENKGIAIFEGTPRGQNHMFKMEQNNKNKKGWYFSTVQTLWPEREDYFQIMNPDQIQRTVDEGVDWEIIEQEYGVSYIAGEKGRYYSEQIKQARLNNRIGNFPYDPNKWVDVIFDLGYRDDTVMGFKQIDGKRHTWIDYHKNNTKDLPYYVKIMKDKGYEYRSIILPHDAEQGKFQLGFSHKEVLQNLLAQAGIHADIIIAPKVNQKQEAIQATRAVFHTYYFNEETTLDLVSDLELYHRKWDKTKQLFSEQPAKDGPDHSADMVSYDALTRDDQEFGMFDVPEYSVVSNWNPLDN